ncbi:hypothetical protein CKF54_02215 [Psittacicella hinzii]|uniref:Uncharacterized protein n=1 Tax=Psittacicella hinzii TaxID=2028575 RepID=A0A3A1Y6A5_9GAMM|nr:hypothetical protein [Psittacicella hinzii]RIY33792.1 hypothetical protein CKF54_02215 [Psittacicella hinzii]
MKNVENNTAQILLFSGLSSLMRMVKNWQITAFSALFLIIGSILNYERFISEYLNDFILKSIAVSFIIALSVTLGIFVTCRYEQLCNDPMQVKSKGRLFNIAIWEALKKIYFLGKPLLILWIGICIVMLDDIPYAFGLFGDNYNLFFYTRNIFIFLFAVVCYPIAGFMINKLVYGSLNKTYRNFLIFIGYNCFCIIFSYIISALILFIYSLGVFALIKDYDYAFITLTLSLPVMTGIYMLNLQVLFQDKYNSLINTKDYE